MVEWQEKKPLFKQSFIESLKHGLFKIKLVYKAVRGMENKHCTPDHNTIIDHASGSIMF